MLHDDAEFASLVLEESIFVSDDIGMLDRSKNSDFIKSILLLFLGEFADLYLLHGINIVIGEPLNLIDLTKCSRAKFFDNLEVRDFTHEFY